MCSTEQKARPVEGDWNKRAHASSKRKFGIRSTLLIVFGLIFLMRNDYVVYGSVDVALKDHAESGKAPSIDEAASLKQVERRSLAGPSSNLSVAWLMSFPNSGTSYTIALVRSLSLRYTATNYGDQNLDIDRGISVPVLEESPQGPFWSDPGQVSRVDKTPLMYPEQGFVLTKTHCGTRCNDCKPKEYMQTQHQFFSECLSSKYIGYQTEQSHGDEQEFVTVWGQYNASFVHRAIHLVRDPLSNIVARFHLYIKRHDEYENNREGFRSFCSMLDEKYGSGEADSILIEDSVLAVMKTIPCHADFFRYVRWHNFAFTTTANMGIPTMVLHYEQYDHQFNQTSKEIIEFLQQEVVGMPFDFVRGKDYADYFTSSERDSIERLLKELAYQETWENIKRYFSKPEADV